MSAGEIREIGRETYLNPSDRHALGDRVEMRYEGDGSLAIRIQAERPRPEEDSNWLPAPRSGPFKLMLRLYALQRSVLDDAWMPPAVERMP